MYKYIFQSRLGTLVLRCSCLYQGIHIYIYLNWPLGGQRAAAQIKVVLEHLYEFVLQLIAVDIDLLDYKYDCLYFDVFCAFQNVFVFVMYIFASVDADNETDVLPSPFSPPVSGKCVTLAHHSLINKLSWAINYGGPRNVMIVIPVLGTWTNANVVSIKILEIIMMSLMHRVGFIR